MKQLEDGRTLQDYNIHNGVFVDMNYQQVSNKILLATRINCGNGSQKAEAFNDNYCYLRALTTTYI